VLLGGLDIVRRERESGEERLRRRREQRTLDVAGGGLPGDANIITFRATGKPGCTATVMILDRE